MLEKELMQFQLSRSISSTVPLSRFPDCNLPLTRQELENAIENLAPDKAYGTDEVSNNFIKHLPHSKVTDLLGIYNRSWNK